MYIVTLITMVSILANDLRQLPSLVVADPSIEVASEPEIDVTLEVSEPAVQSPSVSQLPSDPPKAEIPASLVPNTTPTETTTNDPRFSDFRPSESPVQDREASSRPKRTYDRPRNASRSRSASWKKHQILRKPRFNGKGLLITAGASAFAMLGSGIALSAIYPRGKNHCELRNGRFRCEYEEIYYPIWNVFLTGNLIVGAHVATAVGIAGGIVRGNYDAWRMHQGKQKIRHHRVYLWAGALSLVGSVALLTTSMMVTLEPILPRPARVMIPLFYTTSFLLSSGGLTMLSYGVRLRKRTVLLKTLSLIPFGHPKNRSVGMSFSGRF